MKMIKMVAESSFVIYSMFSICRAKHHLGYIIPALVIEGPNGDAVVQCTKVFTRHKAYRLPPSQLSPAHE